MKLRRVTLFIYVILMITTVSWGAKKSNKSRSSSKNRPKKTEVDSNSDGLIITREAAKPDAFVILVPVPTSSQGGSARANAPALSYGVPSENSPTSSYGAPSATAPASNYGAPSATAPASNYGAPSGNAPASSYGAPSATAPASNYGAPSARGQPGQNEISKATLDGKQEFIVTKDGIGLLVPGRSAPNSGGARAVSSAGRNSAPNTAATLPGGHSVRVVSQNGKLGFLVTRNLVPNLEPGTFVTTSGVVRPSSSSSQSGRGIPSSSAQLNSGNGIRVGSQNGQFGLFVSQDLLPNLGLGANSGLSINSPNGNIGFNSQTGNGGFNSPSGNSGFSSPTGSSGFNSPSSNSGRPGPESTSGFPGQDSLPTVFGPGNDIFGPGPFLSNSGFGRPSNPPDSLRLRSPFTPRVPRPDLREEFGSPRAPSFSEPNFGPSPTEVFTYLFNNDDSRPQLVFKDRRFLN